MSHLPDCPECATPLVSIDEEESLLFCPRGCGTAIQMDVTQMTPEILEFVDNVLHIAQAIHPDQATADMLDALHTEMQRRVEETPFPRFHPSYN